MFTDTDDHDGIARRTGPGRPVNPARTAVSVRHTDLAAVPELRHFARDVARGWGMPDEVDEALAIVVTELVANAVRHSGGQTVTLRLASTDGLLTIEVRDTGRWRARKAPRGAGDQADACSGRGLHLVESYASSCKVGQTARGTRVIVELPVTEPRPVPVPVDAGRSSAPGQLVAA